MPKQKAICETCGTNFEFYSSYSKGKYCSIPCHSNSSVKYTAQVSRRKEIKAQLMDNKPMDIRPKQPKLTQLKYLPLMIQLNKIGSKTDLALSLLQ